MGMIESFLEQFLYNIIPSILVFFLTLIFGAKLRHIWKILRIYLSNKRIPLDIYVSSQNFSGPVENVLDSIKESFRGYTFRDTEVTKGISPAEDKYILCNVGVDPIRSAEILLSTVDDKNGGLVVDQIKILVNAELAQHDRDTQFDAIADFIGEIRNVLKDSLGCQFSNEYAFVMRVPKGKEFLQFPGVRGYDFQLVDAVKKGKKIRIRGKEIHVYSKLDNTTQSMIYELFTIAS